MNFLRECSKVFYYKISSVHVLQNRVFGPEDAAISDHVMSAYSRYCFLRDMQLISY